MSTIVLRSVKGVPLTNTEVDANFSNLNTDKLELGGTYSSGTANGVVYLSASKVLTTGSALTFDGTNLGVGAAMQSGYGRLQVRNGFAYVNEDGSNTYQLYLRSGFGGTLPAVQSVGGDLGFVLGSSEQMRLTSTGLGIGTSSPGARLSVLTDSVYAASFNTTNTASSTTGISIGGLTTGAPGGGGSVVIRAHHNHAGTTASSMSFMTNDGSSLAERMRLDSSGNLGLGVTPQSAVANNKWLEINGATALSAYNAGGVYAYSLWGNAVAGKGINGGKASELTWDSSSGAFAWRQASTSTAGNTISFTQAMTLDASGNLLIGTTTSVSDQTRIHAVIPTIPTNTTYEAVRVTDNTSADFKVKLAAGATAGVSNGSCVLNTAAHTMIFEANNTERARIDSSGNLLVGTTSANANLAKGIQVSSTNWASAFEVTASANAGTCAALSRSSDGNVAQFYHGTAFTTLVGSISVTSTATAYNTSSDYRLKNITGPVTNSGAYIDSLNPVEGTWKADGSTFVGLIAHEVQEASRTNVATGVKDGPEMQGMDYSSAEIIANLIAEVKSLRARVAALEAA